MVISVPSLPSIYSHFLALAFLFLFSSFSFNLKKAAYIDDLGLVLPIYRVCKNIHIRHSYRQLEGEENGPVVSYNL